MKKFLFLFMTLVMFACSKEEPAIKYETGTITGQVSNGELRMPLPKTSNDIYLSVYIAPYATQVVFSESCYSGQATAENLLVDGSHFKLKVPAYKRQDTLVFYVTGVATNYTAEYNFVK